MATSWNRNGDVYVREGFNTRTCRYEVVVLSIIKDRKPMMLDMHTFADRETAELNYRRMVEKYCRNQ